MLLNKLVITDKTKKLYQKNKVCVFFVDKGTNKLEIKKFFEKDFKIKVEKIRTSRQKSVLKKASLLRKFPGKYYTKLRKKAFIKIGSDQELPIFSPLNKLTPPEEAKEIKKIN